MCNPLINKLEQGFELNDSDWAYLEELCSEQITVEAEGRAAIGCSSDDGWNGVSIQSPIERRHPRLFDLPSRKKLGAARSVFPSLIPTAFFNAFATSNWCF